ncbi:MAG: flagellar biosynthetic protein FliR [Verrucomicrobiota bacterium]
MTATQAIAVWLLVMVRAGGLILTLPVFSGNQVPRQLKVALGVLLATLAAPLLPAVELKVDSLWWLIQVVFVEITAGAVLGFICRFTFFALDVTGTLIANELGLNMATILNPGSNSAAPITSTLLYWLAVVTFFGLNIHHWVIAFFIRTYSVLPMGAAHGSEELMRNVLTHTGWILSAGIQIAAPVMAVAFLVTWVFSMLGRAVPQMNVFSESMPVRVLSGLFVFAMSMRFIGDHTANFLRRIPDDFVRVAQVLGHTAANP